VLLFSIIIPRLGTEVLTAQALQINIKLPPLFSSILSDEVKIKTHIPHKLYLLSAVENSDYITQIIPSAYIFLCSSITPTRIVELVEDLVTEHL